MSRWVVPKRPGLAAAAGDQPDGPLARVVKYVPAEIVTAYTLLFSALVTMNLPIGQSQRIVCGLIAVFFVVTIIYVAKNTTGKVRLGHLVVSPVAFLAWTYPISSAVLGDLFIGWISFVAQAIVIALSLAMAPRENS